MDYLTLRLLSALLCGMIISQTGSLIQLGTRNILSSPSTLGFDGLAILWVLIFHTVMVFLGQEMSPLIGAPIFILIGLFFARTLSRRRNYERPILLGITFNLFVGAIFSLWQFLFLAFNLPFPVELWFGHFRFVTSDALWALLLVEVFVVSGLLFLRKDFLLYSLGQGLSENWKLNEKRFFSFSFVAIAVGTFTVVSLYGAFSFLGLIFPLVARKIWFKRGDLKGEILLGSLINGLFLMLIDFVCYSFPVLGAELPVGLIVGAVGAASLIILLWNSLAKPN